MMSKNRPPYSLFDSVGAADAGSSTYPSDEGILTLI